MIGSFLTGFVTVFGFAYPAYNCFKTVELGVPAPNIEELRRWCQYWILVAGLTVCERIGDAFFSWVPLYSAAKLAFFIGLVYKGTTSVYDSFFRPAEHETEIGRNMSEPMIRAMAVSYLEKAISYGCKISYILHCIASQSTPPQLAQAQQTQIQQKTTAPRDRKRAVPRAKEPPSPASGTSCEKQDDGPEKEGSSPAPIADSPGAPPKCIENKEKRQKKPEEKKKKR